MCSHIGIYVMCICGTCMLSSNGLPAWLLLLPMLLLLRQDDGGCSNCSSCVPHDSCSNCLRTESTLIIIVLSSSVVRDVCMCIMCISKCSFYMYICMLACACTCLCVRYLMSLYCTAFSIRCCS